MPYRPTGMRIQRMATSYHFDQHRVMKQDFSESAGGASTLSPADL